MYTPILETKRLILRPLCVEDAPAVFAWASDERVAKYMVYPKHKTIDTTLEWLRSIDHSSDADYDFGFVEKTSGELIGSGGVYWETDRQQWRVGYNLRYQSWGKGYATEAAQEMIRFAKADLNAVKIGSCHAVENTASGHVLEKCGLVFHHHSTYQKFDGSVTFRCREVLWTKDEEELTHHKGTQTLRTERLLLRPFRSTDAADIYRFAGNPKVTRYLSYQTHRSLKESQKIAALWEQESKETDKYNWAIELDGTVIGSINVVQSDGLWDAGLGWQIDSPYWNQGMMTEAARAVVDFLFREVNFHRIYAAHNTRNPASGRVMEKLGMRKEGLFRQHYYKAGFGTGDSQRYGILQEEWLEANQTEQERYYELC